MPGHEGTDPRSLRFFLSLTPLVFFFFFFFFLKKEGGTFECFFFNVPSNFLAHKLCTSRYVTHMYTKKKKVVASHHVRIPDLVGKRVVDGLHS